MIVVLAWLMSVKEARAAIVADHRAVTQFEQIPDSYLQAAKENLRLIYGHTSHGSQIVTGMGMLAAESSRFSYTNNFLMDGFPGASDLGNPNLTEWRRATDNYLRSDVTGRNVVMWSWCGQVSSASSGDISQYLNNMNQLESEYKKVKFIYMTGHLDGTGWGGNLNLRNQQIRDYVKNNNKILFDFADIETYDLNGVSHLDDNPRASDACEWCSVWSANHTCPSCGDCAHSQCLNCYNKAKAFWWLMARLAGWSGLRKLGDANGDEKVNMTDFIVWKREYLLGAGLMSDFNGDNKIGLADFVVWKREYLNTVE